MFAAEITGQRVEAMRAHRHLQWNLDELYVKINGVTFYLWRAVDHVGEVLESAVIKSRDRKAMLKSFKKTMKRHFAIPAYAKVTEVRLSPCLAPQPLSDAAPPPRSQHLRADPRRRSRRVARPSR